MKISYWVVAALLLLSGCATTSTAPSKAPAPAPAQRLDRNTRVYLFDASRDVLFSSGIANASTTAKAITGRIISATAEKLKQEHIVVTNDLIGEAANLRYDIRIVGPQTAGGNKIKVKYRATFDDTHGKKLFVYEDERAGSDMDDLCDRIAGKVVKKVLENY